MCFGRNLGYGLTDLDTLMNIASVRLDGPGDVPGLLMSKVTGGRAGLDANFYRPSTMAVFALIRGLFGWTPAAYHALNIALHAACIALVVAFARAAALRFGLPRPRSSRRGCWTRRSSRTF